MATGDGLPRDEDELRELVHELAARVSWLELEWAHFQQSVSREVRTGRVVIVGDDGHARVVLDAHDKYGHVTVFASSPGPDATCVELHVTDPVDGDGAEVGLSLIDAGDTVATLNVFEGQQARLWIDEPPRRRRSSGG